MRRTTRTRGDGQVAPDSLLNRRFKQLFRVDSNRDGAEEHPLYGPTGQPDLFFSLGPLTARDTGLTSDMPSIQWNRPMFYRANDTKKWSDEGKHSSPLFSHTSKMTCPAFGLPAGPTLMEGGSCAAANPAASGRGLREPGKTYVCDGCYALESNYLYVETNLCQSARLAYVLKSLEEDPTGTKLASDLVRCISLFARRSTMRPSNDRIASEIGAWDGREILAPYPVGSRSFRMHPVLPTPLPVDTGFASTREFFAARRIPPGSVTGFFRIHDSGDFTIGPKASLWATYIRAWGAVAKALPHVIFWAPTRAHVFPSVQKVLVEVASAAPNLVIRPSTLHVGDPVQAIVGLAAPSTTTLLPKKSRPAMTPPPSDALLCPVYTERWDPDALPANVARMMAGEVGEWVEGDSCLGSGCRRCWIDPTVAIAYGWH